VLSLSVVKPLAIDWPESAKCHVRGTPYFSR